MSDTSPTRRPRSIRIARKAQLPDPVKLARYEKSPELGPRILFFSGGTALRELSSTLIRSTYNSVHLITPFDSGGSSAKLRKAFAMPAIGDIRNRLMALADHSLHGNPQIFELFAYRLPKAAPAPQLLRELGRMNAGEHPLVANIPNPMRKIIRHYLSVFLEKMPASFDLRGASIGNIVLAAGYLENRRHVSPVIYIFSKLVRVRGEVHPILNADLHLAARLEDGSVIVGQHKLTGKETPPPPTPIAEVHLTASLDDTAPVSAAIPDKIQDFINSAELICYPMGSFYSSLMANLLPRGVGRAIAGTDCPKVFIPNLGDDPESRAIPLTEQVRRLIVQLRRDTMATTPVARLVDFILVDSERGDYPGGVHIRELEALGVRVIDTDLVTDASAPLIDAERLAPILLSLT
ncbi:GAK system CofD-like protein [Desulfobaculum sp. SPO524]|uniref:GAK system CofD-like protein n=1 Tax=Desulfobaculum sp. SPO524 TaxID=3378071 RepID=UPI003852BC62